MAHEYTREAGVRSLDRQIATLMRKCARKVAAEGRDTRITVDADFVGEALGPPPHLPETAERTTQPGVAVGLANTSHGGDILFIEASVLRGGKGLRLRLTGQLGDVMRESAEAALSWVRANAVELGVDPEILSGAEIHLHVPAGAVPKDGPSAGAALATALVSALTGRRTRGTVATTGDAATSFAITATSLWPVAASRILADLEGAMGGGGLDRFLWTFWGAQIVLQEKPLSGPAAALPLGSEAPRHLKLEFART